MATQSLYRRYRPRTFSEVKGQDHVVRALRDAVIAGREGQAYLFSGPRGTGKTTSARILAKVLNCSNVVDGEPCCECDSCLAVEKGTSYDVHELDAASNNGVEAIRDLIEKASLGTPGRHKVYILDEVHMLSKPAEAALLKTLEEPPPHVVFVLATTDPQKMSDTIRSRTQHLQFHLLPADTMAEHVKWVVADAGYDLSPEAIESALVQGGGSARDTLSALELIASTGGEVDDAVNLGEFVAAMIDHDAGRALTAMAHAVTLGRDPRTVTEELVRHLRNAFLSLMAPELVMLPSERVDALTDQARQVGAAGLVRAIEKLGTTLVDMRNAPDPRVLVEVVLVQLTHHEASGDVEALVARIERLEQKVKSFGEAGPAKAVAIPTDATGRAVLGGAARQPATTDSGAASGAASADQTDSGQASAGRASGPSTSTPNSPASGDPTAVEDRSGEGSGSTGDRTSARNVTSGGPTSDTRSSADPTPAGGRSSAGSSATGSTPADPTVETPVDSAGATHTMYTRPPSETTAAKPDRAVLGSSARRPTADQTVTDRPMASSIPSAPPADVLPSDVPQAEARPTGLSVPDAWDQQLKASLTPLMVRALFAAGHFVGGSGENWKFELPSSAHASRCEPHRLAIESQLAVLVGHTVSIEFVTGSRDGDHTHPQRTEAADRPQADDPAAAAARPPGRPAIDRAKEAAAASVDDEPDVEAAAPVFQADDEIDLGDLTDAPPESVRTPLDHLTEAFPGSQFITDD